MAAVRPSAVLSRIDEGELVELTRDLIRIPSVVRPGEPAATEAEVAAYVERWLRREGFEVEVHEVAPGRPNVLRVGRRGRADRRCCSKATPMSSPRATRRSGATRRSAPTWSTAGSTAAAART